MLLVLNPQLSASEIEQLRQKLTWMGLHAVLSQDEGRSTLAIIQGADQQVDMEQFVHLPGVVEAIPFKEKYKLASSAIKKQRSVIRIKDVSIGDETQVVIMAGPCSVESEEQIHAVAVQAAASGARILRGGLFKPRTSPYEFQGLGEAGVEYMRAAAQQNGLLTISEVMSLEQIDLLAANIDILQIGARNMQNYNLLKALGETGKPILLKRGLSATYNELLLAAEYILSTGNAQVMLCERGIRTFESYTRNTLDVTAVPVLKELSHLPVIIDPSHGVGIRKFVPTMAQAAIAAGADGLIIEVHPNPEKALSDGAQSLTLSQFEQMMIKLRKIAAAVDKTI